MLALPGQEAWSTPELLDDDELDEELDDDELDEDELEEELEDDELEEDELDDEEPVGFPPPQPAPVSNDSKQALATARFTVNTLFIRFLSLLLDDVVRVSRAFAQALPIRFVSSSQHFGERSEYMLY